MPENYDANNQQNNYYQNPMPIPPQEKKASAGLAILSFIIPLVGLILFLTKKNDKPKTAKACGICALVSFLIGVVGSVIMTVAGGALFGAAVSDTLKDDTSSSEDGSTSENSVVADSGNYSTDDNILGDFSCTVKGAALTKDYEGKDAVIITYEFTNNSKEAASFDMSLIDSVFQNGVGLETAILPDEDTDAWDVEIKPGITKETKKAYVLNDTTSPLEVEITEFLAWDDDKIVTTVEL